MYVGPVFVHFRYSEKPAVSAQNKRKGVSHIYGINCGLVSNCLKMSSTWLLATIIGVDFQIETV